MSETAVTVKMSLADKAAIEAVARETRSSVSQVIRQCVVTALGVYKGDDK